MHQKPPPRLVSVHITTPLTKSQRTGTPMATTAPAKTTPLIFRKITKKRSKNDGGLSNLLFDFETVRRSRELHKSLTEAFPL